MSEAERLADLMGAAPKGPRFIEYSATTIHAAAAELRRLSAELEECQAQRRAAFRRIEEQDKELEALKKAIGEPVAWQLKDTEASDHYGKDVFVYYGKADFVKGTKTEKVFDVLEPLYTLKGIK